MILDVSENFQILKYVELMYVDSNILEMPLWIIIPTYEYIYNYNRNVHIGHTGMLGQLVLFLVDSVFTAVHVLV